MDLIDRCGKSVNRFGLWLGRVAAGSIVKTQIPLNPPLLKGDFNPPL
jgi:hypothetical protein